ncbi:cytochrome c-type biogenesis protein CcmH [Seongchinamella sediminis]|uniref:Cytochrome c-type biogenesis protein n=1 Tax=Seongchinamella sediminis TaxID=2283635 RepID=A0A3L7E3T7_9GAMM|nr:cytochrome c-type biogenesis protein [Seongchinamella sediminis]RLQ23012.1 cytochrome c-type biogenesis protein CcmH [Seongchinamella sediminis]
MRRLLPLLLLLALPALAVIETYQFSDPALQQRYQALSEELRCPKCQNQNIADSNAPISQDLRRLLYEQLEAGATDDEIRQYMVDRYGEFVSYRPRFSGATAMLWLAPLLLLALGLAIVVMTLRGRRKDSAGVALSDEEQQRLQALMEKAKQDQ